jgi:hypothetical protein
MFSKSGASTGSVSDNRIAAETATPTHRNQRWSRNVDDAPELLISPNSPKSSSSRLPNSSCPGSFSLELNSGD